MTEELCTCCELPVYSCGKAVEERRRREAAAERSRLLGLGWSVAQYRGECHLCGSPVLAGRTLIKHDGAGWRAACCEEESAP